MNWRHTRIEAVALAMLLAANIAIADTIIPAHYQGVWGTAKSCKAWNLKPSTRLGAPEGGAVITAQLIEFGESNCTVKQISMKEEGHLQASLSCTGEGEAWLRNIKMVLGKGEALKIDDGPNLKKCL